MFFYGPKLSQRRFSFEEYSLIGKVAVNSSAQEENYYYHTDQVGTVLAISNAAGQKVWEAGYKPFGEEYSVVASEENAKRFVGKEKDIETGLNYFGARYLFSGIGRFLSPDAVRAVDVQSGQINAALLANPYRYVDPDGRSPKDRSLFSGVGMGGSQGLPSYAGMDRAGNLRPIARPSRPVGKVPTGAQGLKPVINPQGKQTGIAFTDGRGGANKQVDTIRIMNSTPPRGKSPGYPDGYIKYQNKAGQGVDPYTGKTLPNSQSHYPID
nr:RHS repeat-associated core domain-containing protein [uncultured Desulfuromonas sp.]